MNALPPHLQPTTESASTAKGTSNAPTANNTPPASRSSSKGRPSRPRQDADSAEYTSDKATTALIRKVLDPQIDPRPTQPIGDILPPLTSSNEVDLQLYAIIAIVVKDFVQSWYSKITPDHVFVEELIHVVAHCTRAVEQRCRRMDVEELFLDEIPALVQAHITAYRTSHEVTASAYQRTPRQIYHSINAHPALSPIPRDDAEKAIETHANEVAYRQLMVQGALAVLLPTEDVQNSSLRTLVADIIADLILGQAVSGKICQAWFLHETIIKIVQVIKSRIEPKTTGRELRNKTRSRLDKFGLLSSKDAASTTHSPTPRQSRLSALFWRLLQTIYLFLLSLRFIVVGLARARSLPSRSLSSRSTPPSPIASRTSTSSTPLHSWYSLSSTQLRPVLEYRLLAMVSTLLDLSARMPWLTGLLALCKHGLLTGAGQLAAADSLLDKFLHQTLQAHILPFPSLLPTILLNLRVALFPYNTRAPPSNPPPSPAAQIVLKRQAAESLLSLIPRSIRSIYFGSKSERDVAGALGEGEGGSGVEAETGTVTEGDAQLAQVEELLSLFDDPYMNKHLVYNILELIVARIVPEMTERSVGELMAERGVTRGVGGKGQLDFEIGTEPGSGTGRQDSNEKGDEKGE